MNEHLERRTVELSKRFSAALDRGNISEALDLMAALRPIYEDVWN